MARSLARRRGATRFVPPTERFRPLPLEDPMSTQTPPDLETIKARMRSMWMAGDFGVIARMVEEVNEEIVAGLDIRPGTKVLDVACGTGNSAIPAARRGAEVTGVDIAPNLLEQARARAKAAGVEARFQEGDAEGPSGSW